jgi:hypothetical protein
MIRYRVIHNKPIYEGYWDKVKIVEFDKPVSKKEIANFLKIDISKIVDIEIIEML